MYVTNAYVRIIFNIILAAYTESLAAYSNLPKFTLKINLLGWVH